MEPIPQTSEVLAELSLLSPDTEMLACLKDQEARVLELVPDCVGLSLASTEHGVTFTLVASAQMIALLDALQYVDASGPCIEAVRAERVLQFDEDEILGEERWRLFARGTSATAVASTLSLPILVQDRVVGSVNLYAASAQAFTGQHEALAGIFHAWAPGAVSNADMTFSTRVIAEQAPRVLFEETCIRIAAGVIAAEHGLDDQAARERLRDAAARAGTTEAALAELIIGQDVPDEGPA